MFPLVQGYNWNSGSIFNAVVKILAEEVLSYPVVVAPYSSANVYNWSGLLEGGVHASLDVWITTDQRKNYVATYALSGNRSIEIAGGNGLNVQSGWFIPEWVVDANPALASYRGLKNPASARVLSLSTTQIASIQPPAMPQPSTGNQAWFDTNGKAMILAASPAFADNPNPKLISNLKLEAVTQYTGLDDGFLTNVWRSMILANISVVVSLWSPHQFLAEYLYRNDSRFKMFRMALPTYNPQQCGLGDQLNCDFVPTYPQKIMSVKLQSLSEELYWLIKQISLSNDDVSSILGQMSSKNDSLEAAACSWLRNNQNLFNFYMGEQATWKAWLWFRTLVAVLIVIVIMKKDAEVVKAHGFVFNTLMLVALFPGLISPFFAVGEPTIPNCNLKIWLPCITFVLVFGALVVRNSRIYHIFKSTHVIEINVTDVFMLLFLLPIILIEVALLCLMTAIGGAKVTNQPDIDSGRWVRVCSFDSMGALTPALIVYKVILVVVAIGLAYKTRDIPDRFGESKSIAIAIYNMSVVAASFIVVLFIVKMDETIWFVIYTLTIILVCTVFTFSFFSRIVYHLWTRKTMADAFSNIDIKPSRSGTDNPADLAPRKFSSIGRKLTSSKKTTGATPRASQVAQESNYLMPRPSGPSTSPLPPVPQSRSMGSPIEYSQTSDST
ncbi:hypothetical protein HDU96_008772 [Phlyctochytrium bullatum]|nr:hypothetical protein HDU96_008772 [Phlyctochytrium bullatum]